MLTLRAGPLTARYDPDAGDLRCLRWGDTEILRRVYGAVRDETWDTVPGTLTEREREVGPDRFRIVYESRHARGPVDFVWTATLTGEADGTVTFAFDGEARAPFRRNRIGLCVLHPADLASAACSVRHTDGADEDGVFPDLIAPHQPFFDIAAITHTVAPGVSATVTFSGDVFEMEDQRNWLDASFKTYSTPLALPYPVEVPASTRVRQTVTLRLAGEAAHSPPPERDEPVVVNVGDPLATWRTIVGLSLPTIAPLTSQVRERLATLGIQRLRVDLDVTQESAFAAGLEEATRIAEDLGLSLAVALRDVERLAERYRTERLTRLDEWLAIDPNNEVRSEQFENDIYQGSSANFTELNRAVPFRGLDGLFFAGNPQVHAFDEASIMETPPMIAEALRSASELPGGYWEIFPTLAVSPLTFYGPYAPNDPRQSEQIAAAWYAASLLYAKRGSAGCVDLCEISGPRGLMSEDGAPYPAYWAVQDVAHHLRNSDTAWEAHVSDRLRLTALGFISGDVAESGEITLVTSRALLLVNHTPEPLKVEIRGFGGTVGRYRALYEGSGPDGFDPPREITLGESFTVTLPPYAVAEVTSGVEDE